MNLTNFSEQDIASIINDVFSNTRQFCSIEEAYQLLTQRMCETFSTNQGTSDIVLSRIYHSFNLQALPISLQEVAKKTWGNAVKKDSKFIVLMGTYGDEPEWRDRRQSKGHKTILLTYESLDKIPMVSRLINQIGFNLETLLGKKEREEGIEFSGVVGTYGLFYVTPALNSPYIPAQDFVVNYGIQSVLGTGVMLPEGNISVYIGFSRSRVNSKQAANLSSLMSLFWQQAFQLLSDRGMFA